MKLRGYIALGLSVLITAFLIAGVASGRIRNDFADTDPIVWVGMVPVLVLMFTWNHFMRAAGKREFEQAPRVLGQPASFSPEFVSRWTARGAMCGAATICLMFAILLLTSLPEGPRQWLAVATAVSFGSFCFAIGAAFRARRVIGYLEAELNDQRDDIPREPV